MMRSHSRIIKDSAMTYTHDELFSSVPVDHEDFVAEQVLKLLHGHKSTGKSDMQFSERASDAMLDALKTEFPDSSIGSEEKALAKRISTSLEPEGLRINADQAIAYMTETYNLDEDRTQKVAHHAIHDVIQHAVQFVASVSGRNAEITIISDDQGLLAQGGRFTVQAQPEEILPSTPDTVIEESILQSRAAEPVLNVAYARR
jgi:hypothetical protein